MVQRKIEILPDKQSLIAKTESIIVSKIKDVIARKGFCTLALAGGSTPKPLYEALAKENLPWDKLHIFWGDERYVPADHEDSNQLMARQAWLNKVPIPEANIHPMNTESKNAQVDAENHEVELRNFFGVPKGGFPTLDIILLGMGDDGHTASLFPGTKVLQERENAIAVGQKFNEPRLTFTVPLINQADCVLFLVAGANKAEVLNIVLAESEQALSERTSPSAMEIEDQFYPASLIQPQGELWWLLDSNAGRLLKKNSVPILT